MVVGAYLLKTSTYKHAQDMNVKVALQHPVTAGVLDMRIHDETYKGMWISPDAKVLMTSRVWFTSNLGTAKRRIVSLANRLLVKNALDWCVGRK